MVRSVQVSVAPFAIRSPDVAITLECVSGGTISADPAERHDSRPRRSWVRPAVVTLVAFLLVAGMALSGWWWTHPTRLVPQILSDSGGLEKAYVEPDEDHYVVLAQVDPPGSDERFTFTDADVDVDLVAATEAGLDSEIEAEVMVCVEDPNADAGLGAGAGDDGALDPCLEVRPLLSGEGVLGGGVHEEELILRFRPEGPARFKLRGVDLTYRGEGTFAQRGTQRISADLTIVVK